MAVLAIFTSKSFTSEQYDALRKEVDWQGNTPKGAIFHAIALADDGAHVADVWASGEELDAFVTSRLMPAFTKLQIAPPDVQVYPLHNADAYPAVEQFKVK